MSEISLTYTYNFQDLLKALRSYRSRTTLYKFQIALGAISLLLGLLSLLAGLRTPSPYLLVLLSPVLIFDLFRELRVWLSYNRNEELYSQPNTLAINEELTIIQGDHTQSKVDWQRFGDVIENANQFLLIYGNWLYLIILKRAFEGKDEISAFRDLLSKKIGSTSASIGNAAA